MSELRNKLNDYLKIINFKIKYELQSGHLLEFTFTKNSFPHLIGLHKLIDIPLIQRFNRADEKKYSANYVISKIKKGELNTSDIKNSTFYSNIQKRYEYFSSQNLLSLCYSDTLIDFNRYLLINTKLTHTNYILSEQFTHGYRHLCIGKATHSTTHYVETFFCPPNDKYIKKQKIEPIVHIQIINPNGSIYLEDFFSQKRSSLPT